MVGEREREGERKGRGGRVEGREGGRKGRGSYMNEQVCEKPPEFMLTV